MSELLKHFSRLSFVYMKDLDPSVNLAGGLAACFLTIVCVLCPDGPEHLGHQKKLEAAVN